MGVERAFEREAKNSLDKESLIIIHHQTGNRKESHIHSSTQHLKIHMVESAGDFWYRENESVEQLSREKTCSINPFFVLYRFIVLLLLLPTDPAE